MATSFVSGVGGNCFQSVKPNLNAALYQQPLINKCRELDRCFTECSTRDLHSFLPHLLSNIFGYDQTVGWMLKSLHPTASRENYNAVVYFLSVNGPLFQLLHRLEVEGDIYEFPISHLPGPTQDLLHSGGLPPFCTIRQQSAIHDGFVLTNAFEYYFCHFAYYLIHTMSVPQPWTSLQDCLYAVLANQYMAHFLPARDIIRPSHPPSPSHRLSPANHPHQQSTPSQHSPPRLGLLKVTPTALYQTTMHTEDQTLWRSEVFVQILVDFWLNQSRYDVVPRFDLILHDQFKPSEEHVRVVRMLMKRVHYFANGFSPPNADSHLTTITNNMRSSVIPVHFQSSLYFFLLHALRHWCCDVTYRYVVELWLTYIQPWRYLDPDQPQQLQASNRRTEPVDQRWEPFILSNLHLYTNLLGEFLTRAVQLNLHQRNDVEILARVAKVFAQQGLAGFCWKGQSQRPSFSRSFLRAGSPASAFHEDTAAIEIVPLFGSAPEEAERLLYAVHETKCHAERQIESCMGRRNSPTTPTSAPSQQMTLPPSTPGGNQGWMSNAWNWLTEEAGSSSVVRSTPAATLDAWKKIDQHLQAIEENLCIIFQLSPVVVGVEGTDGEGASPALAQWMMSSGVSHRDFPRCDLSHSQVEPEFEAHSPQLSALGREQVKSGLRTCSGKKVAYRGDPLLQPIRSYENPTLVRALHSVSVFLTDKLSPQLQVIGSSNRLVCKLVRELLAPPPPGSGPPTSEALKTPIRQVVPVPVAMVTRPSHPRVNLRVFASYYTLLYLSLALALGYLLNISVTSHVVIAFLVVFIYSVISYSSRGTADK